VSPDRNQLSLPIPGGENEDPGAPLIYVASALSHLDEQGRQLVDAWSHTIRDAVVEASEDSSQRWRLRPYTPITWSAPGPGDERSPEEIYDLNTAKVWEETDALIVLGYAGGSLGAGQEFAWAAALRLPILYVQEQGTPISRQIQGTPCDLTVEKFDSAEALHAAVSRFVRDHRRVIEDNARRRRDRVLRFSALATGMTEIWGRFSDAERQEVSGIARVHRRRIDDLLQRPLALAAASLDELIALASALGLDLGRLLSPPLPDLEPAQLGALATAAAEYEWDGKETLRLLQAARVELAKGGVRRLPLSTPEDWKRFQSTLAR
jgi:hypothetical protein